MGRTRLHSTLTVLCVVCLAAVAALPASKRVTLGAPVSRDALISGRDFLSMFLGGDAASPPPAASGQLRTAEGREALRAANIIEPHERLAGLVRSQDRLSHRPEKHDPHHTNTVDLSEDTTRSTFKYSHSIDRLADPVEANTEDATTQHISGSLDGDFGERTFPQTSSNKPSSVATHVPSLDLEDESTGTSSVSEADHQTSTVENEEKVSGTSESFTQSNDANFDATEKIIRFSPKFSMSSSVKKFTSKESKSLDDGDRSNDVDAVADPNNTDNEVSKEEVGDEPRSTESLVEVAITGTSTEVDDGTSEPTVTASVEELADSLEFRKVGVDPADTEVKVVSVRVTSSVGQQERRGGSSDESAASHTEDRHPVTALQRSELLVEESSPSEVTALPVSTYTTFLSSKFQGSPSSVYHPGVKHTSPQPVPGALSYQASLTPASARRLQFFNHPPRNYPGVNLDSLKRPSGDAVLLNGYRQDGGSRRFSEYRGGREEPASVAESIQRSVIARQDGGLHRSHLHRGKGVFEHGGYQPEESKRYAQQPERVWAEPEKVYGEPEKVYGEPEKVYGEPEKVYGEPEKVYGEPEKNYEVDEAVSVLSNGRAHGVQAPQAAVDSPLKMTDPKQSDPNHKFGYVVEGRNFRKYRVEERTPDGFIVGEYGVVSHDDGSLRGVRYTADESINPRLIYDTLVKFLSL